MATIVEPKLDAPGRGRIYDSIVETIANTPLVRIKRFCASEGITADILLKLEFFNPMSSVKDRIGVNMILQLEREGKIKPGSTLIEPTSGNTGIGLAFAGAARGYRVILVMPDSMSIERRKMLAYLGAELHLSPRAEGMAGAMKKVQELLAEIPGSVMPGQFSNPANPEIHKKTTAEEIWRDTGGAVDAIVSGIGTGGTFTGTGQVLKPRKPSLKMIAVEPELSPVLSGGKHSPHIIQGIGAGFIPEIMDMSLIDQIIKVSNDESVATARKLAKVEGIPTGISGGAALAAACKLARQPEMLNKMIVTVIPDFAERYISTVLFEGIG
ncbi:MAG: cysteine synthase A [Xanthobacteraceae bacterium]